MLGYIADPVGTHTPVRVLFESMPRFSSPEPLGAGPSFNGATRVVLARTPPIVQTFQDCVAVSIADNVLFEHVAQSQVQDLALKDPETYERWLPSRRKLYWDGRAATGLERSDAGTNPRGVMNALRTKGVCAERWCPYEGSPVENPLADNDEAARYSADQAGIELYECSSLTEVMPVLLSGHRVLFAGTVHESFAELRGGEYVPGGSVLGAHMFQIVGFEDVGRVVRVKNQWPLWGDENQESFIPYQTLQSMMLGAYVLDGPLKPYSELVS